MSRGPGAGTAVPAAPPAPADAPRSRTDTTPTTWRHERGWWIRAGVSLASGLLLSAAFPPADVSLLAPIAMVGILASWRGSSPGRAAAFGFIAGLGFFGVLLSWTWYFGAVAIVPLVASQAAYWAGAAFVVAGLGRAGIRSPWLTGAVWVIFEAVRDRWPLGGFAWGEVGGAFHGSGVAHALASWGGVPLLGFLLVAAAGLAVDAAAALRRRDPRPAGWAAAGLALVVLAGALAVPTRFEPRPSGRLRVAMLQGNRWDRYLTQDEIDSELLTRSHLALAGALRGRYDLIVFPESALDTDPRDDPALRAELEALGRRHHSAVLVNVRADERGREYNMNRLYDPDGTLQGSYAKQHLVPFGEYVPFRWLVGWLPEIRQHVATDFTPGRHSALFHVSGRRVGTVICFESAFAPLVRKSVRDGAELVVVSTNNRSYRRSANSAQHVALSQLRAAETGRPVLQASISGITAVIDAEGHVRQRTRLFRNQLVSTTVETTTGRTPYVRFGDWVVLFSAVALAGATGLSLRRRMVRRRPPRARRGDPTPGARHATADPRRPV